MSSSTWDRELSDLAGKLGEGGTIDPAQAEMLKRLIEEVSLLTRGRPGRQEVVVRTATALTDEEQGRLRAVVTQRFGAGKRISFEVDPQLLGGVWLRVGDRIIDGSLRGRLEALRKELRTA